jgi:quinohemoprotein ethanol dehydrogenase
MRRPNSGKSSAPRALVLTLAALALAGLASSCGGDDNEAATEPATTTAAAATEPGTSQAASGAQLFSDNCQSCHGPDGAGGHVGPNLQKSSIAEDLAQVKRQVNNGGGAMPPFSGVLSDKEIDAVAHHVVEQIAPKG